MNTKEVAICELELQLDNRGYNVARTTRNGPHRDLRATKGGKVVRFEVKGLKKRNGIWLKPRQVAAVDAVVVYIDKEQNIWVLTSAEAQGLLDHYYSDFVARTGLAPKGSGWNASRFPPPTGWGPLDQLA